MDLFTLPPFYHGALFITAATLFGIVLIALFAWLKPPTYKPPKDIYTLSIQLQEMAPEDPLIQELLRKSARYKYRSDEEIPKKVHKELLKYHKRLWKSRYNRVTQLKRSLHEKARTLSNFLRSRFRKRL